MDTLLIIANILGYTGLILLFIQVVFGTRHIFKYFTTNTVLVSKVHKYLGMYGILFVFVHPVVEMFAYWQNILWIFTPNFSLESERHITFGRFAIFLLTAVWVTSAVVREKIKWRPWKYVHLLSYPIVFFAFIHMLDIGTFFQTYPLVKFVWAALFIAFLVSCIYRLLVWAGIGKKKFEIISKKMVGEEIILIKIQAKNFKLDSKIGQHFFLQTGRFKSEHPFTIIKNEDGVLSFGIRKVAGFWDEMVNKQVGGDIFVDGPYGVFTREAQNNQPKVIISAGIGVTPFVDLVDTFGDTAFYINCNRSADEVIERELLKTKSKKYLDLLDVGSPEEGVLIGRINPDIIKNFLGNNLQNLPYFVCGSPGFIKFIKQVLTGLGIDRNNIYYEELGF